MRKLSYLTDNLVPRSPRSCAGLRKWRLRDGPTRRAQEGPLKLPDERQSLKRKENWRKLLLLGIQTGDKLAKPPFFVAHSRLCRHCRNLAEGGCRLSRFHFRLCRYFLGHVACRNLPWQGLYSVQLLLASWKIVHSVSRTWLFSASVWIQQATTNNKLRRCTSCL